MSRGSTRTRLFWDAARERQFTYQERRTIDRMHRENFDENLHDRAWRLMQAHAGQYERDPVRHFFRYLNDDAYRRGYNDAVKELERQERLFRASQQQLRAREAAAALQAQGDDIMSSLADLMGPAPVEAPRVSIGNRGERFSVPTAAELNAAAQRLVIPPLPLTRGNTPTGSISPTGSIGSITSADLALLQNGSSGSSVSSSAQSSPQGLAPEDIAALAAAGSYVPPFANDTYAYLAMLDALSDDDD